MSTLQHKPNGGWVLDGRALSEGDEIEVLLGGNAGWQTVTVEQLANGPRVAFEADDGARIVTTLPADTTVRWPD
jgi:hypothetical protein